MNRPKRCPWRFVSLILVLAGLLGFVAVDPLMGRSHHRVKSLQTPQQSLDLTVHVVFPLLQGWTQDGGAEGSDLDISVTNGCKLPVEQCSQVRIVNLENDIEAEPYISTSSTMSPAVMSLQLQAPCLLTYNEPVPSAAQPISIVFKGTLKVGIERWLFYQTEICSGQNYYVWWNASRHILVNARDMPGAPSIDPGNMTIFFQNVIYR